MNLNWMYGAAAVIIAVVGFFLGHKTKESNEKLDADGTGTAKEVFDVGVEKIEQAADEYADAMADTPDGRVKRVLAWYRKRTGVGGD